MLPKRFIQAAKAIQKGSDEGRRNIRNMLIDGRRAVQTDGHVMIVGTYAKQPTSEATPVGLLDPSTLAAKDLDYVSVNGGPGLIAHQGQSDIRQPDPAQFPEFPKWADVLPRWLLHDKEPGEIEEVGRYSGYRRTFSIQPNVMAKALAAFDQSLDRGPLSVDVYVKLPNDGSATLDALIFRGTCEGMPVTAVVMPCRKNDET